MAKFIEIVTSGRQSVRVGVNLDHVVEIWENSSEDRIVMASGKTYCGKIDTEPHRDRRGVNSPSLMAAAPGYVKIVADTRTEEKIVRLFGRPVVGWAMDCGAVWRATPIAWEGAETEIVPESSDADAVIEATGKVVDCQGECYPDWDAYISTRWGEFISDGWRLQFFGAAPRPTAPATKAAIYAPTPSVAPAAYAPRRSASTKGL